MGVATPFPTLSHSSTAAAAGPFPPSPRTQPSSSSSPPPPPLYPPPSQNRTLNALEARRALQARADAEFEDPSRGREFLDAGTLRRALLLHNRGVAARDIETRLRLKDGVVARLGPRGVAVPVDVPAANDQT